MDESQILTLRRALTALRELVGTSDHLDQAAVGQLKVMADGLLSLVVRLASEVERLEEQLLSRGVLCPQDSRKPPKQALEALVVHARHEWTRITQTRVKKDGPSIKD